MDDVVMKDETDFVISRVLNAHKGEVKAVAATSQGMLLSGGRDETVRMWLSRGGDYTEHEQLAQSPKGAVVYSIAVHEDDDGWKIFVGRKDGAIVVYERGNDPILTAKHHTSVVSCLYADSRNGKLISGSWDNHVIIWPINELKANNEFSADLCQGHTMSVWAVASIESTTDIILSASADRSIRVWKKDVCIKELRGHSDVVRSLVVLDSTRFLSASNDFTLRLWSIDQDSSLATIKAPHEEFMYSVTRVTEDTVVSCGEGGHIVVWRLNEKATDESILEQQQVVSTPVASLWSVATLPNKDIALASSDGRIFIMTRDPRRVAPKEIQEVLDSEMAVKLANQLNQEHEKQSETVTIKVALDDGAPNLELKYVKGTDPSLCAEKFITDHQLPISYLGEIIDYIKANIPEARNYKKPGVNGVNGGSSDGKMSVSVLIEDGRSLLCSFSLSDDPDEVAQSFVETNSLPIKYLASTSHMVRKAQEEKEKSSLCAFYDPLTGGGRYVPSSSNCTSNDFSDPYTSNRYIPGSSGSSQGVSGGDPLTSSGRYVPGTSTDFMPNASLPVDKKKPRGELCPLSKFFLFGLEQFSQKAFDRLVSDNDTTMEAFRLNESQLELLKEVATKGAENMQDVTIVINTLNVGLQWKMEELLPIFDLFRIAILNEEINKYYTTGDGSGDFLPRILALLVSDSSDALKAVVCRTMCNLFVHQSGRDLMQREMKTLIPIVASLVLSSKVPLQLSAASALCNWAYLLLQTSEKCFELGPREDGIREIVKVLESHMSFGDIREDALTRILQSISTFMWGDSTVIKLAKSRKIVEVVNRIKDAVVDERSKSLARDIVEMTFAI